MSPYARVFVRRDAFVGSSLPYASRPRRFVPRSLWTRSLSRILLKMKSFLLILFEMARGHWRGASTCARASCTCMCVRAMRLRTPPHTHLHARSCYASAHASAHAPARMSALRIRTRLRTRVRVRLCRAPARALVPRIRAADSRISSETRYDARETEANPRLIERGGYDADRRDLRHARQA